MSNLPLKKPGAARIIAAADLHLGRRVPAPEVIENSFFTPEGAWEALVDLVLDPKSEVDALVLAGDILDNEDDVLEAPFYFEQGLKRLQKQNIPVILIAGNHDWRFLKVRHELLGLGGVHILGAGGKWESRDIEVGGQTIRFEGWSFPAAQYSQNPLDTLSQAKHDAPVTIGLLHGDWQSANSPYAPFSIKELIAVGRQVWVLGHIHIPKLICEDPLILSAGSLQGLDPSEQGERGVFRIDIDAKGRLQAEMVPMAALLFETVDLDVTDLKVEEYIAKLQKKLENTVRDSVKCLSLEVVWKGQIDSLEKKQTLKKLQGSYFHVKTKGGFADCFIRKSILEVTSAIDIEGVAKQDSIAGFVAKQLLRTEDENEIGRLQQLFEEEARNYPYLDLDFDAKELQRQGHEVLFELLGGK
jgi:exonuclease SbcD